MNGVNRQTFSLIEPQYTKAGNGRCPAGLAIMLRDLGDSISGPPYIPALSL